VLFVDWRQEVFMIRLGMVLAAVVLTSATDRVAHARMAIQTFTVLAGAGAHDVFPAPDGTVWFTAQSAGKLGRLDPRTGKSDLIALGPAAAPHGVIVAPDCAAWVTEGGQNAIARIDPATRAVKLFPLPKERRDANLNTASFDRQGVLWFTGQNGIYGRLDPKTGAMAVFDAPRGTGPYGIATTPDGQVFFASLAGNYLGQIDLETGTVAVLEPPVPRQGARRVWSDSRGALWITGWNSGDLFRYDSKSKTWARWHLPGDGPQPYAVYVDETDAVWVSDWGANAILRFDPKTEKFDSFPLPDRYAGVRQLAGRGSQGRNLGCRIGCRQALCAEDGVKYASGEYRGAKLRRMRGWSARRCRFCDRVGSGVDGNRGPNFPILLQGG
jgi:virginiamycin B lyase